jgi:flagellar hook-associated protein 3 FlgL
MRISTSAASQSALMDLMRAQREQFDASQQLSSGKKAADLKGYANSAETIFTARSTQVRAEGFISANERLAARLEVQDLAYRQLSDAATELRTVLTTNEGTGLMNAVEAAFDKVVNALSTKFAGSYVFSGVRTDTAPINATTLAELQAALPDTSAVFENADRRQTAQIDSETTIEVNQTASQVAGDLVAVFERLADFNDGPNGPFDGSMTAAQRTYVQGEIANVIDAFDTINAAMGENGTRQARVEASITSHRQRADYLAEMIAGLEDADMAEAATRLTQAQTAVEVSAATFSSLSQVSLLPFLR